MLCAGLRSQGVAIRAALQLSRIGIASILVFGSSNGLTQWSRHMAQPAKGRYGSVRRRRAARSGVMLVLGMRLGPVLGACGRAGEAGRWTAWQDAHA